MASGLGLWSGKHGVRWSFLLNVPYIIIPVVSAMRFLRQRDFVSGVRFSRQQPQQDLDVTNMSLSVSLFTSTDYLPCMCGLAATHGHQVRYQILTYLTRKY